MHAKKKLYLFVTLTIFTISLIIIACSGEKTKEPEREGEAALPERGIDEPLRAERISEEEYAEATEAIEKTGPVDNPVLPLNPMGLLSMCSLEMETIQGRQGLLYPAAMMAASR